MDSTSPPDSDSSQNLSSLHELESIPGGRRGRFRAESWRTEPDRERNVEEAGPDAWRIQVNRMEYSDTSTYGNNRSHLTKGATWMECSRCRGQLKPENYGYEGGHWLWLQPRELFSTALDAYPHILHFHSWASPLLDGWQVDDGWYMDGGWWMDDGWGTITPG